MVTRGGGGGGQYVDENMKPFTIQKKYILYFSTI